MKKNQFLIVLCCLLLISCGGGRAVKPSPKPTPPTVSKPAQTQAPVPAPTTTPSSTPTDQIGDNSKKPGGYYLDDGPDANPPKDLDNIPNATPKKEPLLPRSNKPYKALGVVYTPMTISQNYKERGLASWYGKRFHGKKTSSGEVYDMYNMTAAHTRLPLPSYAKVTNIANGRSVIVRVNDRGPFKSTRIIDLSYAAAYKLRLISQGSGMVEVEAIHPDQISSNSAPPTTTEQAPNTVAEAPVTSPVAYNSTTDEVKPTDEVLPTATVTPIVTTQKNANISASNSPTTTEYFIQAGAFKNEANADTLMKKIQGLEIEQNAGINRVYNNGLHRLKLGPYDSKEAAEEVAASIRRQLNIATIITNQQ